MERINIKKWKEKSCFPFNGSVSQLHSSNLNIHAEDRSPPESSLNESLTDTEKHGKEN